MGLIYNILKRTITKKLTSPLAKINTAMIVSRSDKVYHATIMRLADKFNAKKQLTGKDKYDLRIATRALEKRGSLKWIKTEEIPDTM